MFVRYQGNTDDKLIFLNHDLDNVSEYKHLGVIIQSNLSWNSHIDYICKKATKRLDILNRVSHKLSRKSLETMYFSYVCSILKYADILFTSSDAIYEELSWQRLSNTRQNRMTILYSDIIHHRAPSYLLPHIPETVENRVQARYPLRNSSNLSCPTFRTETYRKSSFPSMTLFWNNLEENRKHLEKTPVKTHLTEHKPKCNPFYYLGNRQFNIIMARLRMRCSELRQHLFDMNIIEDNKCECGLPETTSHFFLGYPLYIVPRRILCDFLLRINYEFTVHILLYEYQ